MAIVKRSRYFGSRCPVHVKVMFTQQVDNDYCLLFINALKMLFNILINCTTGKYLEGVNNQYVVQLSELTSYIYLLPGDHFHN